ncbi:hypothetical protein APHCRT_0001 [Anaplasma phagocytophilum str. CRT53-1]|uniref:Uncharacterized protein n=1 Tax=Anaplasma phagocytophilum str. CRT53-1 TaxID=1359157 RepID=A0A0F3PIW9_ANAPH|nr:hypothetical protein [Anaplasma phagocytophilum]KJV80233.1 hypothetical protein APHCRT_1589 [Anaplasma phagocytophilum str. CRT53-1]KJV88591.1 hypothetical protein APHCRT_0001 [Anaplasma phagocytophilum str. CRT53-1]
MYGIDIELSDYRIGSETISSGDDGYYEGCACDKDASTNAYSYDKCRVVRGTWRPSELVLYVGDEHVACRDVASGMHHGHLPGKVYFIEAEAGRDATAEGGVYTTVVEALSLVQEEEGTGMYLINAPEKAVVRFFKIEKSAAEEPQTVDPSVVESATGSGVDTQEEQEIDQEAPAIEEVEKVEVSAETKTEEQEVILEEDTLIDLEQPVAQVPVVAEAELPGVEAAEAIVPSLEENKLQEVVVAPEAQQLESAPEVSAPAQPESTVLGVTEGDLKSEVSVEANADVAQKEVISGQQEQEIAEALEGTEAPVEVKEETEVLLKEDTLIDLEQPVAQVPVVAEAELPGVEAAEAIVPSLEENKLQEVVVAPEAQQLESAPEVSAPAQPESAVLGVAEGDLKSEVSVEANADVAQKEVISGQQEQEIAEALEGTEAPVEVKEETEVLLKEDTLIDLEQPVAQVPVVAEAELPGVEAAEAIVPSLEENKLQEVVVAPEAQQLESAPEVSAPAQPESTVLGVTEGDLKSEVSVEANADVAQKEVISGQQEQEIAEALEGTEAPVEVKEETEVLLKEDTLIDLEQPVAQVPVVAEAELPGVEAAEAIVPSLEENKLQEVVVAPEAQQLESAPEVSAPAQPESTVLGVTEGDLKSEVSVEANADVAQKEVISGQQEQEIAEALEGTEAPVEVKEETEVLLKEDTLIDLEQPVAQVPVVAEAELPGVEAAEAIVPSLEENKLQEVVVAPEAQQLESAPEVSAPAQPESTVLGVTEGDLKSEVSVEANAGMQQEAGISDQETQATEEVEKVEVSVEADAGMQQELADVPTALPLKDPDDEDVLSY